MLRIVLKSGTQPDQPIDQTMALVGAGSEREPKLVVFLARPPEVADANRARFEKVPHRALRRTCHRTPRR